MKIVLLGATGSIGMSACNCIRRFPEKFEAVGLSSYNNAGKLMELVREFQARFRMYRKFAGFRASACGNSLDHKNIYRSKRP